MLDVGFVFPEHATDAPQFSISFQRTVSAFKLPLGFGKHYWNIVYFIHVGYLNEAINWVLFQLDRTLRKKVLLSTFFGASGCHK